MKYTHVISGEFICRPNRFIAQVRVNNVVETVHVKNTGRCRELLVPGCTVYLSKADNPVRKTQYDLIAVQKECGNGQILWINMDSQIVNDVAEEWLRSGTLFPIDAQMKREVRFGNSRFDFYLEHGEKRAFLEVKGVTLEQNGVAMFPDAPTARGAKHLRELVQCVREGYEAYVLFVIQMKNVEGFRPNDATDPDFGEALRLAQKAGVHIFAIDCRVTADEIVADSPVEVRI